MMFTEAFTEKYNDSSEIVAICDCNKGRLDLAAKQLVGVFPDVKCYPAEKFDDMLRVHKPDCVIVTTRDCAHDDYICRSLEAGCDVITEKPMTIDEHKCQRIVDTIKKTGRKVRVTFNYRYSPPRSQIKKLLMDGIVGKILSVNLSWYLDTNHGADYFRRWHSNKSNSGGLLVHKSTHHFDLVNWWLSSVPQTVFAKGQRVFYNAEQACRYGLETHGDRCFNCKVSDKCNFYLDMRDVPLIKQLYLDNEKYDGYIRDRCVFRDDIDIEDSVGIVAQYQNGAILTYSLNAFMPWEGYRLEINGTKGRLEQLCHESSYISGDGKVQGGLEVEGTSLKIYPHFQTPYEIPIWQGTGAHGGGDIVLLEDIFGSPAPDPLKRAADYIQGAYSILLGIAANNSIKTGKMIMIDDLVKGLPEHDFVCGQTVDEKIPYVSDAKLMAGGKMVDANVPQKVFTTSSVG
jgi:predicted dehydrogenase